MSRLFSISRAILSDKRFYVLLLLAATVFAQVVALDAEGRTHHGGEHCCLLCHVCQPALEASAPVAIAPLVRVQWIAPDPQIPAFSDALRLARASRGPPSIL